MSFSVILNAVVTIAAALPQIRDIIDKFVHIWNDHKISKARQELNHFQIKEKALLKSIKEAKDDETRMALSIILSQLS